MEKECSFCKKVLDTSFFDRCHMSPDGFISTCNLCRKIIEYKRVNMITPEGYKWCSGCDSVYPIEMFYIRDKQKCEYNKVCMVCSNNRHKERSLTKVSAKIRKKKHPIDVSYMFRPAKFSNWVNRLLPPDNAKEGPLGYLLVSCKFCGQVFMPTASQVMGRANTIESNTGEANFYCSPICKTMCPVFNVRTDKAVRAFDAGLSEEDYDKLNNNKRDGGVQEALRKEALARAGNACERCGATDNLKVHHIQPVKSAPMLSEDIDNLMVLCHTCHMLVHQGDGCSLGSLRKCILDK